MRRLFFFYYDLLWCKCVVHWSDSVGAWHHSHGHILQIRLLDVWSLSDSVSSLSLCVVYLSLTLYYVCVCFTPSVCLYSVISLVAT